MENNHNNLHKYFKQHENRTKRNKSSGIRQEEETQGSRKRTRDEYSDVSENGK